MRKPPAWRVFLAGYILLVLMPSTGIWGNAAGSLHAVSATLPPAPMLPPPARLLPLSLQVLSQSGNIRPDGTGWRIGSGAASLVVRATAGAALRSISVGGILRGAGTMQVAIRQGGIWQPHAVDEPSDRDASGLFSVGPIDLTPPATAVLIGLTITPRPGSGTPIVLQGLRAYALAGATLPCGTHGCLTAASGCRRQVDRCGAQAAPAAQADTLTLEGTSAHRQTPRPTATPLPAWQAPRLASSAVHVASRDAWGSPDGEGSPNWIPFYKLPFHIILHHTGEYASPGDPLGNMQSIWADHALTRGWGDIGYNYVIDTEGRIYEGRAGGDQVAGGHTHGYNVGSIGISLIGDYDQSVPPAPMLL
ncbi:MAG TPA: N-acetylmuramoyl-L-alanine amidase, partial [Chloroflexota bacterium]|nr:N-acetylmuramoyl-L-alanine amidase [Chloroflexota bacterium]